MGSGNIETFSVLSGQFCCEPKIALKIKSIKKMHLESLPPQGEHGLVFSSPQGRSEWETSRHSWRDLSGTRRVH